MIGASLRLVLRLLQSALVGLLVLAFGVWLLFLFAGPELQPWHRARLDTEFTADREKEITSIADYRALEYRLFKQVLGEVYAKVYPGDIAPYNRFAVGSRSDPGTWLINWNRTFEITPPQPVGGVLLLHGLTDSPYSMRSIGADLGARGWLVVGLRLPGHGTAPSGLLHFEVEDLEAATRIGMRDLRARLGPGKPLYIVGYSTGATLAVNYALEVQAGHDLPRAAGLVLVSPSMAVTRLAVIGRIRTGISALPGFGRAAWQLVEPEVDPYKYQSFSFHAAGVVQRLTSEVADRLADFDESGKLQGFPPVLAFVSTVDSTVRARAVVDVLFGRLAAARNELVLFDVNREAVVQPLLVTDPGPLTQQLLSMPNRPFTLTVITNVNPQTRQVQELRATPGSPEQRVRPLDLWWPDTVFSLSHVALPFPPDDPLYGYASAPDPKHVQLGRIEARGENGVLRIPAWMLTRQRSNPFHAYMLERIDGFLGPLPATR